jgi:hypothetical protein
MTRAQGTKMGLSPSTSEQLAQSGLRPVFAQISADKSKQIKTNESKNAFFCFYVFFRIGTFQRVTADSNKKIFSLLNPIANASNLITVGAAKPFTERNGYSTDFCFL